MSVKLEIRCDACGEAILHGEVFFNGKINEYKANMSGTLPSIKSFYTYTFCRECFDSIGIAKEGK